MADTDPIKTVTDMQRAWMDAWAVQSQAAVTLWTHLLDMQQSFFKHASAHHRTHVELPDGPSFTDKYGKRAHDIDPERDV